ncbi:MAG: ribosome silencing factor [candidate division NC10 bacterium]|nr:ribosome silencing factor [candidate division NC10 bacterium]
MGTVDPERLVHLAAHAAWELKALDPVIVDLRGISSMADHFLICSAESGRHVRAIADYIGECLAKVPVRLHHVEGYPEARWILLDYHDLVIHIFDEETRRYYNLEWLWGDAPQRVYRE